MHNENKEISVWVWLIPVYIIVAIPLVRLLIKLQSPDIKLSKEDMKAFSGSANVENTTYRHYEPDFSDLDYAVNYKTQGTSIDEEDYYKKLDEKQRYYSAEQKKEVHNEQKNKRVVNKSNKVIEQQSSTSELQKQQMMSVGFRKGFLTNAVSSFIQDPKRISALFNNSFVVKGFLSRDIVKNNLASPQALENYLTKTNAVSNFLNNSVVQVALKNPQIVGAVAGSALGSAILNSPAVQGLLKEPDKINEIIKANPQITTLLADPNITSALMNNPDTAKALIQIQGGGNIPDFSKLPNKR